METLDDVQLLGVGRLIIVDEGSHQLWRR
jgi:hypothetical protein